MQTSNLHQLLQSFSSLELRELRKFLTSPFYNTRSDLVQLFDYLVAQPSASKAQVWQQLLPGQPYDDQKLRLLMSYLHRLLEQYLTVKEITSNDLGNRLHLAIAYRKRGLSTAFERTRSTLEKAMNEQPLRDAHFYHAHYQLTWEQYHTATAQNPAVELPLKELASSIDLFYLSSRLRMICFALAQQSVYQADNQDFMAAEVVALAESERWASEPTVAVFLHCYRMLKSPEAEVHFQGFKQLLQQVNLLFKVDEIRELNTFAINYCIRRLNDGQGSYLQELLDLYKSGLGSGHLIVNGVLSRFTYHNIVGAGLRSGDLDWVNFFIHEYRNALERSYRESSFSFSLARLEFARRRYGAVLELLQKANYRDPLLNLAAKTLLLKTWYELGEHDLLHAHLDAMRNYIHRKRVIGYHRTNYLNIVRYSDKLLRLNLNNKKEVEALKAELEKEEVLTEKEWLVGQVGN
jgi:hypothetical protein